MAGAATPLESTGFGGHSARSRKNWGCLVKIIFNVRKKDFHEREECTEQKGP